MINLIY